MKNPLYVVEMQRFGSYEDHSYVAGVFSTRTGAAICARAARLKEGGKYEPNIVAVELDRMSDDLKKYV